MRNLICTVMFGCLLAALPAAAENLAVSGPVVPASGDLNGDGLPDLVLGSGDGRIYVAYQVPSAMGDPAFTRPVPVLVGGAILDVGDYASPIVMDLDRDGKLDLVIGDADGKLTLYNNIGLATAPVFADGKPVTVAGSTPAGRTDVDPRGGSPAATPTPAGVTVPAVTPAPIIRMPGPSPQSAGTAAPPATVTVPRPQPGVPAPVTNPAGPPPPAPPVAVTPAPAANPVSVVAAAGKRGIAVTDFVNEARVVNLDWLSQGVPDILALAVPYSDRYELLPRERFQNKTLDLVNLDETFRGVAYVLQGRYRLEGEELIIETNVVDMESISVIKSFASRGNRGNAFEVINQLEAGVKAYFESEFPARLR